jgi:hypothetical protein
MGPRAFDPHDRRPCVFIGNDLIGSHLYPTPFDSPPSTQQPWQEHIVEALPLVSPQYSFSLSSYGSDILLIRSLKCCPAWYCPSPTGHESKGVDQDPDEIFVSRDDAGIRSLRKRHSVWLMHSNSIPTSTVRCRFDFRNLLDPDEKRRCLIPVNLIRFTELKRIQLVSSSFKSE